MDHIF